MQRSGNTIEELSNDTDLTRKTIITALNAQRRPTVTTIIKLGEVLDFPTTDLLEEKPKLAAAIGWYLQSYKDRHGLTDAEIAKRVGISTSYILKLAYGQLSSTSNKVLESLGRVLEIPDDELDELKALVAAAPEPSQELPEQPELDTKPDYTGLTFQQLLATHIPDRDVGRIARLIGITPSYLQRLRVYTAEKPSDQLVVSLAVHLGLERAQLFASLGRHDPATFLEDEYGPQPSIVQPSPSIPQTPPHTDMPVAVRVSDDYFVSVDDGLRVFRTVVRQQPLGRILELQYPQRKTDQTADPSMFSVHVRLDEGRKIQVANLLPNSQVSIDVGNASKIEIAWTASDASSTIAITIEN